ncbi:hypothetical protein D3C84_666150 [compost metagenome]
MIPASANPMPARLNTMAGSESSQSGSTPQRTYSNMLASNKGLRPRRSATTPANGASKAIINAGKVNTTGTSTALPGTSAKCACIRGNTGASSTAPSTGKQLPSSNNSDCAHPAWRVRGSTKALTTMARLLDAQVTSVRNNSRLGNCQVVHCQRHDGTLHLAACG